MVVKRIFVLILYVLSFSLYGQTDSIKIPGFCISDKFANFLFDTDSALKAQFVFAVEASDSIIAITFDDGPGPYTGQITYHLRRMVCPATFFLNTQKITKRNLQYYKGHGIT